MRKISKIIVHCSDSTFGNALIIEQWHKERGFRTIGYHFVILNGYYSTDGYFDIMDGQIEFGRPIEQEGAHCKGQNSDSIGICLIGEGDFTTKQLESLDNLILELLNKYNLTVDDVYGHYEFNPNKSCPCMDMAQYREHLRELI